MSWRGGVLGVSPCPWGASPKVSAFLVQAWRSHWKVMSLWGSTGSTMAFRARCSWTWIWGDTWGHGDTHHGVGTLRGQGAESRGHSSHHVDPEDRRGSTQETLVTPWGHQGDTRHTTGTPRGHVTLHIPPQRPQGATGGTCGGTWWPLSPSRVPAVGCPGGRVVHGDPQGVPRVSLRTPCQHLEEAREVPVTPHPPRPTTDPWKPGAVTQFPRRDPRRGVGEARGRRWHLTSLVESSRALPSSLSSAREAKRSTCSWCRCSLVTAQCCRSSFSCRPSVTRCGDKDVVAPPSPHRGGAGPAPASPGRR